MRIDTKSGLSQFLAVHQVVLPGKNPGEVSGFVLKNY
jgi:hypothetical protein